MLDFGEEITIETFKIPWLIWIQIIILLLLIVLLYCFSLFSSDLDSSNSHVKNSSSLASPSFASSSSSSLSTDLTLDAKPVLKLNSTVTHRFQPSQVGGNRSIKGEISTSTSRRIVRGEENTERDTRSSSISYHPCHYFRLAKEAFLKCLGLHFEKSSNSEQRKDR